MVALALAASTVGAGADELSGADKLRLVYANQLAWTKDGLPLVTVRIAEGRDEVRLAAEDLRVLPDGEGGAEVRPGTLGVSRVVIRVRNPRPGRLRYHVIVARLPPGAAEVTATLESWRSRGFAPRTFETGVVLGIRGEVLDSRRVLVAAEALPTETAALQRAAQLAAQYHLATSVYAELVERPSGVVEAVDERGLSVGNEGILWFAAGRGMLEVAEVDKESGGRESRRYLGRIYVTVDRAGKLAVVNAVPEDKLLAGLVPAEMPASAPLEALKAQAVAARNELLAKLGTRHLTDPYRLCSTKHCQVYAGAGSEDPRSTRAVEATRGELLIHDSGGLVDAVYSASCGGHTEDNERAWGGVADPSLRGRPDGQVMAPASGDAKLEAYLSSPSNASCARGPGFRWRAALDLNKVAKRLGMGRLRSLEVVERGVSGRAIKLAVVGETGASELRGELEIRRALGDGAILKSSLFVLHVERDSDGFVTRAALVGGGHGHGIGMCQDGAMGMAEAGATYREILRRYYQSATTKRLY